MGYGYDESDSFIDNSEAVSAGRVRVAKGAAWEAEPALGTSHEAARARA